MIDKTIQPTDWHRLPEGERGRCPICDCPKLYAVREHRVTTRDEGYERRHVFRVRRVGGWVMKDVGQTWQRSTDAERDQKIGQAAKMFAFGRTFSAVAAELGVPTSTLGQWRLSNSPLWQQGYDEAMGEIVEVVRKSAGSDVILKDVDHYLQLADAADKWVMEKGEELFPQSGEEITLCGFHKNYYLPNCTADPAKSTLELHQVVLKRWRLLTGDPPLSTITTPMLAKFRDCLMKSRGMKPGSHMSPTTVHGFLRLIHSLLMKAGPPGYRNHDAASLIDNVPWVRSPRQDVPMPRFVSTDHINAVYEAADVLMRPEIPGIEPATWWRALLVVALNTGLRRRTLFSLRWEYVDLEGRCIDIPANRLKSRRAQRIHVNDTVHEHLTRIRGDRDLVLPWPYSERYFHRTFHRLQYEAGIPGADHFGLHDLRKTLATKLWENSPEAAQLALGHAGRDVTIRHYVQSAGIVARALDVLPQPAAFKT